MHFSDKNYIYRVGDSKIKCVNCPENEDEYNDVDTVAIDSVKTVTINGKEILRIESTSKTYGSEPKKVGVVIKTK